MRMILSAQFVRPQSRGLKGLAADGLAANGNIPKRVTMPLAGLRNRCKTAIEPSSRELEFFARSQAYIHEVLTLRNLFRFLGLKDLHIITADHRWDKRDGGF